MRWLSSGRKTIPAATAFRSVSTIFRIASSREAVSHTWPACCAPEAMPNRKTPSVMANDVALEPVVKETVRKKKIS